MSPAAIFGERSIVHRVPAWHKIGIVFDDPISTMEAISRAKLDYHVGVLPLFYEYEDDMQDSGQKAIVREPTEDDPTPRFFGTVSDRYRIIQNDAIARAVAPLTDRWDVESAGALGFGESFFISFLAGTDLVANEEIKNYFLLVDDKTGTHALRLLFTPVRVVCQNTLAQATKSAIPIKLRHTESLAPELDDYVNVLNRADATSEELIKVFNQLASTEVSEESVLRLLEKVYPTPQPSSRLKPYMTIGNDGDYLINLPQMIPDAVRTAASQWQVTRERIKADRGNVYMLYDKISEENPIIGDTAWAAFNAVAEYEDHLRTRTGPNSGLSELFGDRAKAKARAFTEVSQMLVS